MLHVLQGTHSTVTAAGDLRKEEPSAAKAIPGEKTNAPSLLHSLGKHLPLGISPLPSTVPWMTMPLGIQTGTCHLLPSEGWQQLPGSGQGQTHCAPKGGEGHSLHML